MLMEGLLVELKVDKFNKMSPGGEGSWHILTEGLPVARKVDGRSPGRTDSRKGSSGRMESSQKLKKGLQAAWNVDGNSQ